jgi:hypothetical protein
MSSMGNLPAPVKRGTHYERYLMATALYDARGVVPYATGVKPEHFSDRLLGAIWGIVCDLHEAGIPQGIIFVGEHMRGLGWPVPDGFTSHVFWLDSVMEWWSAAGEPEQYAWLAAKVIEASKVRSING